MFKFSATNKVGCCNLKHSVIGGLGDAVCALVCESGNCECVVKKLGDADQFGKLGDELLLLEHYNLSQSKLYFKVKEFAKEVLKELV